MVLISSVKYACETCIKGHRSSACKHTDRPLFEIKKKGRPITQCEHCRELRKTKQVHVKCICTTKAQPHDDSNPNKRGINKTLQCAAFPNGLPEAMEASVATHLSSEGSASDSDHNAPCACNSGGDCHCCTPRKTTRKPRQKPDPSNASSSPPSQPPAHIRGRVAEYRPVLPRPPSQKTDLSDGPVHYPSDPPVHGRHHNHESLFYSPYGRAYDYNHPAHHSMSLPPVQEIPAANAPTEPWLSFSPTCTCGDGCRCPGCTEHNGTDFNLPNALASCMDPATCGACLNCSFLALQTPLPANSTYDYQALDDWMRQLPTNPTITGSFDFLQSPKPSEPANCPDCGCLPGLCQCELGSNLAGMAFSISEERASCASFDPPLQMPIAGHSAFLEVPETFRSRSSSTSSDSSGFSSGHVSASSSRGSSSLAVPIAEPFSNAIGTDFWSA